MTTALAPEDRRWKAAGKAVPATGGAKLASRWLCGLMLARQLHFYSFDKKEGVFRVAWYPEEAEGIGTERWDVEPLSTTDVIELCSAVDPDLIHALTAADRAALATKFKIGATDAPKAKRVTVAQLRSILEASWEHLPPEIRAEAEALGVKGG